MNLLGGFEFVRGRTVIPLSIPVQRLVAFLALRQKPVRRPYVAETLWFDTSAERASGNLRTALWRLRRTQDGVLLSTGTHIALAPNVQVDLRCARDLARSLVAGSGVARLSAPTELGLLVQDLLPDWYDEWVFMEREQFRQLRLHGLEALCRTLTAALRYGEAIEAGLAAVISEPLRESAHEVLIQAYLSQGNHAEAVRHYSRFADLLRDELGVGPSRELRALVQSPSNAVLTAQRQDAG